MKNLARLACLALVVSLATIACGATPSDPQDPSPIAQTEQATVPACNAQGAACEIDVDLGNCCKTCPTGQFDACENTRKGMRCTCVAE